VTTECVVILEGDEISSYNMNRGISKSWNNHVKGLHQLWTSYNSNMQIR